MVSRPRVLTTLSAMAGRGDDILSVVDTSGFVPGQVLELKHPRLGGCEVVLLEGVAPIDDSLIVDRWSGRPQLFPVGSVVSVVATLRGSL